jgi:hypothetical protein
LQQAGAAETEPAISAARERSVSSGRPVSGLAILHVDPKTYKMGAVYQVDLGAKLVEAPSRPGVRTHIPR